MLCAQMAPMARGASWVLPSRPNAPPALILLFYKIIYSYIALWSPGCTCARCTWPASAISPTIYICVGSCGAVGAMCSEHSPHACFLFVAPLACFIYLWASLSGALLSPFPYFAAGLPLFRVYNCSPFYGWLDPRPLLWWSG